MDITTALDRHLDQADSTYATYPESDNDYPATPMDESTYLLYEIRGIEKILATDSKYDLVTPAHWHERLTECRTRLRRLLEEEHATLKGTSLLHCEGLIKCHSRQVDIEAQLAGLGVA